MARPIRNRPNARRVPAELSRDDLVREIERSGTALVAALALVRALDEHGLLRLATDVVTEEDRVLAVLTERVPADTVRRAGENLRALLSGLRDLDPDTVAVLAAALPRGLREARKAERDRAIGWLELATTLRDPDVNRGLRMLLGFLRGVGRAGPAAR